MWCANCNKTSYSDVCEVCGGKTQQDTPIELYWCDNCRVPIIREVSDTSPMICPSCGKTIRYLAKDLRPVFPEERLLLEVVKGTPLAFINSSVWASGSRYYIDGKTSNLSIETLKKVDVEKIVETLTQYKDKNDYSFFNENIRTFIDCNRERLDSIKNVSLEKAKQIKPLEVDKVKAFLNFFIHRKYENDQEKNEFFNSFINRVVLYDDKILIFYNTDTNRPAVITRKDTDDLLAGIGEKIEKKSKSTVKNEKNSLEPQWFKRVSLGGR